ncbi:MAG: substrate binding domain-containing protein [Rhodobacteraceae bacterium]|nr:substrate binding domain-containing protein [Paracoccaceae bacterium]
MRISAPIREDPIDLSSAVRDFLARHPKVEIDLNLETRIVDPIAEGYDVVVRVDEPNEASLFVDHRLAVFEYVVCAAPSYLEDHGEPETPEELRSHRLLHFSGDRSITSWRFLGPGGETQIPVSGPLCANSIEPVRMAAITGLGVAVLPSIAVAAAFTSGELKRILTNEKLPRRVLQVIYPPSRRLSAKVRLFTDFLIERFEGPQTLADS